MKVLLRIFEGRAFGIFVPKQDINEVDAAVRFKIGVGTLDPTDPTVDMAVLVSTNLGYLEGTFKPDSILEKTIREEGRLSVMVSLTGNRVTYNSVSEVVKLDD